MEHAAPISIEPGNAHNEDETTRRNYPSKPEKKHDSVQPHNVDGDDTAKLVDKHIKAQDVRTIND